MLETLASSALAPAPRKTASVASPFRPLAAGRLRPESENNKPSETRLEELLLRVCVAVEALLEMHKGHRLAAPSTASIAEGALNSLSPAEHQLLNSVLEGLSNKEIASRRATSIKTVKGQLTGVYKKLGVSGRGKLLARMR